MALTRAGMTFTVHEYVHAHRADSYGAEAAAALGVPPERVFKTLLADVDGRLTVAVVPVDANLDLKALAAETGGKRATMADPDRAERATGYVRGGISPVGQRTRLPVVLDDSALEHPTVYVSAGRRGLELELEPDDLVAATGAAVARVRRAG